MINATELKKGMVIEQDDGLFLVTETTHITPGNKRGILQAKIKSLKEGHTIQRRFRSSDRVEQAFLEARAFEYLYEEKPNFVFMDLKSFEQIQLSEEIVGEAMPYISHNSHVQITFHDDNPISIDLPGSVVLEVKQTDPGAKGNTVSNVFKPATLETGLETKVPMHIAIGNRVKVDTRTGAFIERVNQ